MYSKLPKAGVSLDTGTGGLGAYRRWGHYWFEWHGIALAQWVSQHLGLDYLTMR